jgi:hypothetical protein
MEIYGMLQFHPSEKSSVSHLLTQKIFEKQKVSNSDVNIFLIYGRGEDFSPTYAINEDRKKFVFEVGVLTVKKIMP